VVILELRVEAVVLTDLIWSNDPPIEIFTVDTALPEATDLISDRSAVWLSIRVYYPQAANVDNTLPPTHQRLLQQSRAAPTVPASAR
jgi:hypothetical protein